MTISSIIKAGKGTSNSWRVVNEQGACSLYHYSTRMLTWNSLNPNDESLLGWSIGWGSVSDQNGMNTAFKVLGIPYRYSRDNRGGGPRIEAINA